MKRRDTVSGRRLEDIQEELDYKAAIIYRLVKMLGGRVTLNIRYGDWYGPINLNYSGTTQTTIIAEAAE